LKSGIHACNQTRTRGWRSAASSRDKAPKQLDDHVDMKGITMTSSLLNLSGAAALAIALASFFAAPGAGMADEAGKAKGKEAKACCKDDKCCKDQKCCKPGDDKAKAGDKKSEKKADCCTAAKCC
jgi:hypothetical protein